MAATAKRFCVLAVGRSGSTALIEALAAHADIAVPRQGDHRAEGEMLNQRHIGFQLQTYGRMSGRELRLPEDLVEAFFHCHVNSAYAGFKLMPWQLPSYRAFVGRTDIFFVLLRRRDLASMVASWFVANRFDTWKHSSKAVVARWTFGQDHVQTLRGHLIFIHRQLHELDQVRPQVALDYEDLCSADFRSPQLDSFFGRHVALVNPQPPTHASEYLTNWAEFSAFVESESRRLRPLVAAGAFDQLGPSNNAGHE